MAPDRKRFVLVLAAALATAALLLALAGPSLAFDFTFTNVTDQPGGPGQGGFPSLNLVADVAFAVDDSIVVWDRSEGIFHNLMLLPGAPVRGWHPRLNDAGNVAFVNPNDRHVWLYEADGQVFTDLATVAGFPGTSGSHSLYGAFDLNNGDKIALHAGDLNYGDIHVYDHTAGTFVPVTDLPGAPTRGRDCRINDADQVAYSGYPDTYIHDLETGLTRNITDLPGGPGTGLPAAILNDRGDIAISSGSELMIFTASDESFQYLSTLPDFPASTASVDRNDLGDDGAVSFWADEIYYYDPADSTFTQLTGQGVVPYSGHESKINDRHYVVFEAGADVWLAAPAPVSAVPSVASGVRLDQNHPNPFNPQTQIAFELERDGTAVRLDIVDLRGHRVRTLVDGPQSAGRHVVLWDGRNASGRQVASGTYLYRLRAAGSVVGRAMQLVR
ncbi:MAG: hypothetical protein GY838_14145 [bacterium]|nr:hypothetical protein [bacterium]